MTVSAMILLHLSKIMSFPSFQYAGNREAVANVTITECFNVYLNASKVSPVSTNSSGKKTKPTKIDHISRHLSLVLHTLQILISFYLVDIIKYTAHFHLSSQQNQLSLTVSFLRNQYLHQTKSKKTPKPTHKVKGKIPFLYHYHPI